MHAGHCVQQQQRRQRGVTRGGKSRSTPAPALFCRQRRCVAAAAHTPAGADFYEPPYAVLICPGFLDGYDGRACTELKANLEAYFAAEQQKRRQLGSLDTGTGTAAAPALPPPPAPIVEVLRVRGSDWWLTLRGGSFGFYVDALADAVGALRKRAAAAAARDSGGGGDSSSSGVLSPPLSPKPPTVALVALSAAGWVARLALGPRRYEGRACNLAAASGVAVTLVTLGTPHDSLEAYPFGRTPERLIGDGDGEGSGGGSGSGSDALPASAAASSLRLANHYYPDAAALAPARLVCVCGSGVRGAPLSAAALFGGRGGSSGVGGIEAWLAGVSYKATCGQVEADGDGVTPLDAAFVRGAAQVVLPGVRHGPGRGRGGGTKWYGSAGVVPLWAPYLMTAVDAAAHE